MTRKILILLLLCLRICSYSQIIGGSKDLEIDSSLKIITIGSTATDTWIGTTDGLYKINKKTKKVAHLKKENSTLPSNNVTAICPRKNGDIWIGTSNGILRFDNFSYMVINSENANILDNNITALAEDNSGDMWIGTFKGGLVMEHKNRFKVFNNRNSILPNNHIFSLSADDMGNVWVAPREEGLICISYGKHWKKMESLDTSVMKNITFVLKKNDNSYYVGTNKNGLFLYENDKFVALKCSKIISEKFRYVTFVSTVKKYIVSCESGLYLLRDITDVKDTANLVYYNDINFLGATFFMDF
jgi:ligand-binding sensor domain-containing protein